uniref:Ig-like domain-containing protein n=1 Tax=Cyprinus carpio carpio TaxID=630221 RepID=A0A9J7XQX2_CYPCA
MLLVSNAFLGIAPVSPNAFVSEGNTITLSCNYNGSAATDALHWYRQYPRSRPDFLFLVNEAKFDVNKMEKKVHLEISSAAVTDSALYYCALEPTVTGNTRTLHKKLFSLYYVGC